MVAAKSEAHMNLPQTAARRWALALTALASFTALLPGAMLTVFAAATFLRGGNVGRGKSAR